MKKFGKRTIALVAGAVAALTIAGAAFAAVTFDPSQAQGLDAALQELSQTTGGPWILTAVALGLFMFGAFSIVRARYLDE